MRKLASLVLGSHRSDTSPPMRVVSELRGFGERVHPPIGGLATLDFFRRGCERCDSPLIVLRGGGTFHRIPGGVATDRSDAQHPREEFGRELEEIRGEPYAPSTTAALFIGSMPASAQPYLRYSAEFAEDHTRGHTSARSRCRSAPGRRWRRGR